MHKATNKSMGFVEMAFFNTIKENKDYKNLCTIFVMEQYTAVNASMQINV